MEGLADKGGNYSIVDSGLYTSLDAEWLFP